MSEDGECPAKDYLDSLQDKDRGKCLKWMELLEKYGHQLRRPYADFLKDGVYELRPRFRNLQHRFLYFYHGKIIVLTHGFLKKSGTVEINEIKKAVDLRNDWEERFKKEEDRR